MISETSEKIIKNLIVFSDVSASPTSIRKEKGD